MNLEDLGFTKDELQKRVIDQLCERMMIGECEWVDYSEFRKQLNEQIKNGINDSIECLAEKHVLPNVAKQVEEVCLQETNAWGEAIGDQVTFIEYLVLRAEKYLTERVDRSGDSKEESTRSYEWKGTQTRVTNLVNRHLHSSIEKAMKIALERANSVILQGIEETVKLKLAEIVENLKIDVKTQ